MGAFTASHYRYGCGSSSVYRPITIPEPLCSRTQLWQIILDAFLLVEKGTQDGHVLPALTTRRGCYQGKSNNPPIKVCAVTNDIE